MTTFKTNATIPKPLYGKGEQMKKETFRRHGDVYIIDSPVSVKTIRDKGKRVESPVLAYGEVTGHKHELMDATAFERYEFDGKTYLVVNENGVSITHEEHGIGFIDAGVKEVRIDREYDYMADMARNSID